MPTQLSSITNIKPDTFQPIHLEPSYHAKYKWYPVPPDTKPDEVVKLTDKVWIYYTVKPIVQQQQPNPYGYYGSRQWATHELEVYLSINGGANWLPNLQNYDFIRNNQKPYEILEKVCEEKKKLFLNEMARNKAKETREANKVEAEKLGISVEDLKKQRSEAWKKKVEISQATRSVEEIKQLMELSKSLTKMSSYIESIKGKMSDENVHLNLAYFSRKMKNLDESVAWLKDINTTKESRKKKR